MVQQDLVSRPVEEAKVATPTQVPQSGLEVTCSQLQEELLASLAQVKQLTDSTATNAGLLSVLLQGSRKLPEVYVQPEEAIDVKVCDPEENIQLPLVDISVFDRPASDQDPRRAEALTKIVNSFKTWGFVQIVGHGVDLDLIKTCEDEAHRLFQLPVTVKQNALRAPGVLYGYGSNFFYNLRALNWVESFHINASNVQEHAAKLWPNGTDYEQFSTVIEKYLSRVEDLGHRFRRILTEGLGVPPHHFDQFFGPDDTVVNLRMNFYPPCPDPSKALGLLAHRDPHFFTMLHQDDTGGLQIWNERRDEWFNVKPIPNSFIINVGDMLQAASNGVYRSVLHRAVVNDMKARLSMASFYNTKATLVAPDELITAELPQRYRPFSWPEYVKEAYAYTTGAHNQIDDLYAM